MKAVDRRDRPLQFGGRIQSFVGPDSWPAMGRSAGSVGRREIRPLPLPRTTSETRRSFATAAATGTKAGNRRPCSLLHKQTGRRPARRGSRSRSNARRRSALVDGPRRGGSLSIQSSLSSSHPTRIRRKNTPDLAVQFPRFVRSEPRSPRETLSLQINRRCTLMDADEKGALLERDNPNHHPKNICVHRRLSAV